MKKTVLSALVATTLLGSYSVLAPMKLHLKILVCIPMQLVIMR
ncbi:hypothetical protein [Veillonella criceti]|uniref:Uncharacterized protein n=1 Tax=Veillonella criceti TaxID=103891 RepID=A0A380NGQ9_9FIRM|nr:hypothetical protein [Veillonella criceti]SUP40256.1 Uncharacterised protein [Veillonella criceti]